MLKRIIIAILISFLLGCGLAAAEEPGNAAATSVIEGTLIQVSKLPPAASNPYPDCYFTAVIDINHILKGQSTPGKIVLVLPGFFSRRYTSEASLKQGDRIRASVVPFETVTEKVKQTQQADEIEDVDLKFYFPENIVAIQNFEIPATSVPFSLNTKKQDLGQLPNLNPKASAARQQQIKQDLEAINALLAKFGGDWKTWYNFTAPYRERYRKEYDAKATRWIGDSFFSAGTVSDGEVYSKDFIASIVLFKDYLAARNIDLIILRVPEKGEIVDDIFTGTPHDEILNPYLLRLYKELLEADVEIITDVIPRAKKKRKDYPLMYWYQDFPEPHPAEGIAWVIAEAFNERLNRYEKLQNWPKSRFKLSKVSTGAEISTDSHLFFWPEGNRNINPKEYVTFSSVRTEAEKVLRSTQGVDSPILMVGSSYIEYPSLRLGGNIPAYLAYLSGIVPDILYRSGSGAGIPRAVAREDSTFLKNRIVCLFPIQPWVFFNALSTPPIVDVNKAVKILLASYGGEELAKHHVNPKDTAHFSFINGKLKVEPLDRQTRAGGSLSLKLPESVSSFNHFIIEVEGSPGDAANITAKYAKQTDMVSKSYSQKNSTEVFVFKPHRAETKVELSFANIRSDIPTIISSVKIYGIVTE